MNQEIEILRLEEWEANIKIEMACEGVDWSDLAEDRHRWRAVVRTAKKCGLHKIRGFP
jgi:hypothetical protein